MGTNYIAPIWRMPENANNTPVNKLSNYSIDTEGTTGIDCGLMSDLFGTTSIDFNTSYSIWIKPEFAYNVGTYQTFFGNLASGNFGVLLYYHTGEDKWFFIAGNGSTNQKVKSAQITSDEELGRGEWQHHCVVYDYVNGNAYYYINNLLVSTTSALTITINNTGKNWYIGKKWDLSSGTFTGKVAQACIFDYALSTDQRNYLYNLNNPMAITGAEPIAYWPLGDNSNPNANAGYPNISVGADSVFNFIPHDYINLGDPDYLSFGDSVNDSPFTMSAWIKTTGNGDGIISKWGANPAGYEWIFYIVQNKIRVALYDATTSNVQRRDGVTIVNTGEWVHALITYDGRGGNGTNTNTANQGIKIYINGIEESSYTDASGGSYVAMHNTIRPVQIGTYNTTSSVGFDGEMANVQIWRTDLTGPEVTTLYNNGQPLMTGTQPQEANLKAWYKLNQTDSYWDVGGNGVWTFNNAALN